MTEGIIEDPVAFAASWRQVPADRPATMTAAVLVDPVGFRVSTQAATDNVYMDLSVTVDEDRARAELFGVARVLTGLGVPTLVLPGKAGLDDAVFPNNVYGFPAGRFVVGAMKHPVRQAEASRADVRALMTDTFGRELVDLSAQDVVAELTGVLATDWSRGVAVCGLSGRVDRAGAAAMREAFGLRSMLVTPLVPTEYHLNLVLAVLAGRALVCWDDGFADPAVPRALAGAWPGQVLHLSEAEKNAFAGNCLAVTPEDVVMSRTAWAGLCPASRAWFATQGFEVHAVGMEELEKGGGSLRCLVAEVF